MTTSNKNFKVKNGLEVLGTSATVNGNEVLTIASSIAALSDVDLTGAVEGNSLVFDAFLNLIPGEGAGGGIAKYYVSDTKPLNPQEGLVWYNSASGEAFIYIEDEDSSQWVELGGMGPAGPQGPQGADSTVPGPQGEQGESGIVAQPDPPTDTSVLWYDTDAPGFGIPLGGSAGQVLSKIDAEDFNTEWVTPYGDDDVALLVDNAPTTLNTLGKIAASLGNDDDFEGTVQSALDQKANVSHTHAISNVTGLQAELDSKSNSSHNHNSIYYTKDESNDLLSFKADTTHNHDDRYYTETEMNTILQGKADEEHTHVIADIIDIQGPLNTLQENIDLKADILHSHSIDQIINLQTVLDSKTDNNHIHDTRYYTETETDILLSGKSDISHIHDDRYYTETEVDLAISAALAALVPSGTIIQSARSTAPAGYLTCDGSAISRTTYSSLFSAIGTAYGSGDGSTTFNIPNLKGKVPVGYDPAQTEFDALGETGGAKTHTLTVNEMPSHTHIQDAHNHTQNSHNHTQDAHRHWISAASIDDRNFTGTGGNTQDYGVVSDAGSWSADDGNSGAGSNVAYTTATNQATTATNNAVTATNQNTGGGAAHNNLQPYVVLNYMIKI